jgi:hypothetical protein
LKHHTRLRETCFLFGDWRRKNDCIPDNHRGAQCRRLQSQCGSGGHHDEIIRTTVWWILGDHIERADTGAIISGHVPTPYQSPDGSRLWWSPSPQGVGERWTGPVRFTDRWVRRDAVASWAHCSRPWDRHRCEPFSR